MDLGKSETTVGMTVSLSPVKQLVDLLVDSMPYEELSTLPSKIEIARSKSAISRPHEKY